MPPLFGDLDINWFLKSGEVRLASLTTGCPGIAVPPGLAHSPLGENKSKCLNVNPFWDFIITAI